MNPHCITLQFFIAPRKSTKLPVWIPLDCEELVNGCPNDQRNKPNADDYASCNSSTYYYTSHGLLLKVNSITRFGFANNAKTPSSFTPFLLPSPIEIKHFVEIPVVRKAFLNVCYVFK